MNKIQLRRRHKVNSRGFTIVELMMATIVFSVIMLIVAAAVVRFTANFQRGATQTTTQNTARSIIDEVSQSLQFSTGYQKLAPNGSNNGYYVNPQQYSYALGKQVGNGNNYALVARPAISPADAPQNLSQGVSTNSKELLGDGMRLARFDINEKRLNSVYEVTIRVAYGDDDLLCSPTKGNCNNNVIMTPGDFANPSYLKDLQCKAQKGSQYCAVSELSTTVQRRIQ